jgi:hypothetical protein
MPKTNSIHTKVIKSSLLVGLLSKSAKTPNNIINAEMLRLI